MEIYSMPDKLLDTVPEFDIHEAYPWPEYTAKENEHRQAVKNWLMESGYHGKNTGGILQMGIADGHAEYMLAEAGRGTGLKSCLIHLPYGDAWHHPEAKFLPKKEVIERIKGRERIGKLFGGG
jgi:hypothetical protein